MGALKERVRDLIAATMLVVVIGLYALILLMLLPIALVATSVFPATRSYKLTSTRECSDRANTKD